ncbi:MAG: hypothetical protein F4Z77_00400 [Dehalococcoidia bacterium]|nr:hypothetical protein [Chloroflexota bacterium]MXW24755.1 hypothetical protein [Dehalococcoidia bacterium]MXZ87699.1 hypothetical protein [Dehalococcoidia bacterium]MYA53046.1 hypothetical protein [Dehalococcoidia bacterium]MYI85517.1 hypothetical protein [Dehalococcoidia bacterium]
MPIDQHAARRRWYREFFGSMIAFAATLVLADFVVEANPDAGWRYAVALLPVIPGALVVVAAVRFHRRIDELQQRIALEAIALAFAGTAVITFIYGFAEDAVDLPRVNWTWVWGVMGGLWLICDFIVRRRRL